eukprot:76629_1
MIRSYHWIWGQIIENLNNSRYCSTYFQQRAMATWIQTTNFFEADLSSTSHIYNLSKFPPTTSQTKKIFNIQSCEFDNRLPSSPTQNMVDIFHQSNQTWQEFENSSKISIYRDRDYNIYNVLRDYKCLFESVAFNSYKDLSSYHMKFQGSANKIIQPVYQLYKLVEKRFHIAPNTCVQFNLRFSLQPTPDIAPDSLQLEEDPDDEEAKTYSIMVQQQASKNDTDSNKKNPIMDPGTAIGTYDDINIIPRIVDAKTDPFSYGNNEIIFDKNMNNFTVYNLENSSIPKEAIQYGHTLNPIVNSVNSMYNQRNTLTITLIVYPQRIVPYWHITTADNKRFGSVMCKHDLINTIPCYFEDNVINDDIKHNIQNNLKCKENKDYNAHKAALLLKNNKCDEKKKELDI